MFENTFLYTAYTDDSTFFLKDKNSVKELLNTINYFSSSWGLKPNLSKCTEAAIGALKRVKVAICGMKCIDLTKEAIKILGALFSYDKNLQLESNFKKTTGNIERFLKMWKRRNLKLEGKIIISKTLAFIVDALQQIQKYFLWNSSSQKMKHETICKNFQNGALKNVDIKWTIISLQYSWVTKLYDESFHEWKIITVTLIKNTFGE